MLSIREATCEDVEQFILHIDPMDLDELNAHKPGRDLKELLLSYLEGNALVCVDEEDYVYSFGGVEPSEEGAWVWFLTSDALRYVGRSVQIEYLRLMRRCRDATLEQHGRILNFIWDGNENHKEFIKRLGGTFHEHYRHSEWTAERFQLFTIDGGEHNAN